MAAKKPTTEDAERERDSGNTTPERPATPEMQKTPAKTPSKSPAATKEKVPRFDEKDDGARGEERLELPERTMTIEIPKISCY